MPDCYEFQATFVQQYSLAEKFATPYAAKIFWIALTSGFDPNWYNISIDYLINLLQTILLFLLIFVVINKPKLKADCLRQRIPRERTFLLDCSPIKLSIEYKVQTCTITHKYQSGTTIEAERTAMSKIRLEKLFSSRQNDQPTNRPINCWTEWIILLHITFHVYLPTFIRNSQIILILCQKLTTTNQPTDQLSNGLSG